MATLRIRDDLGRDLYFARPPERIVSLVPSDTFTLFRLGAGPRVVGRTSYCEEPAEAAPVAEVGGTKGVDVEAVLDLAPQLVIANQEENTRPALERLAQHVPVLVSLPRRVADSATHIARLARILGLERDPVAADLVRRAYTLLRGAPDTGGTSGVAVFVPIWMEPLMTFNADTFGSDVLAAAGARNVFGERLRLYPLAADLGKAPAQDAAGRDVRYPRVRFEEVVERRPDMILLPDEPHAFSTADEQVIRAAVPDVPIARVSGKDLFWYGAWTLDGLPRLSAELARLRRDLGGAQQR